MELKQKITRFRAYQLGNAGSSFSYFDGTTFTLIEGRLTENSEPNVQFELEQSGKTKIDTLHITSWDNDHCRPNELKDILNNLQPNKIEYPGYEPHTDSGNTCLSYIKQYEKYFIDKPKNVKVKSVSPKYLNGLESANNGLGYSDIIYHPRKIYEDSNDNSTVKFFRSGSFTLLSLGDVEKEEIATNISSGTIIKTQVDIMILAHHGADNGFTTDKFLKAINPKIAICSSNYDNQFSHPKQAIRDLIYQNDIQLFTTKTGDVVIKSINSHNGEFQVFNLISNNDKISSDYKLKSKRME
jgi:competence protein ComEC